MRLLHLCTMIALVAGSAVSGSAASNETDTAVAVFAGGCFWCMEPPYDKLNGVTSTTSGYIGGSKADATYERVSSGRTAHLEAVRIEYDPKQVSYEKLLEVFWHNIDPLDGRGQFCDTGPQYASAVYALDDSQFAAAEASKKAVAAEGKLSGAIQTKIVRGGTFYPAEDYHQDYYRKNPVRYKYYRWNCGRDQRLKSLWGDAAGH